MTQEACVELVEFIKNIYLCFYKEIFHYIYFRCKNKSIKMQINVTNL